MDTPPDSANEPVAEPTQDVQPPGPIEGSSARYVWLGATTLALVVAALIFAQTRHFGLLGYDSYPIIITSRVQSFADLTGNFTETLMDGRYAGDFYRPLLNLTFALDYAVWRLKPIGYQLTNALLFAGGAVALFALVRRLVGGRALIAPLAAMVFFLLHPALFEVVPVPPRRADLLCCLFLVLSLTCQLSPNALAMTRPPILPALFGLLAIGSKDIGLVLPVLAYVAVLLCSPRRNVLKRVLHAFVAIIPQIVAAGIMIAARVAVIGGLGGHRAPGLTDGSDRVPLAISRIGKLLLFPQPVMEETSLAIWLACSVLAGLMLTGILLVATRHSRRPTTAPVRRPVRTALFAVLWVVLVAAAYLVAAQIEPWYLFLPVAGLALFVGAVTGALAAALRRGRLPTRVTAAATLLLLWGLAGWQMRYSPLFQEYDEYERATAAGDEFFQKLRNRIDTAPDGSVILAPAMPTWVRPRPDRPTVFGAAILADYSVQAWAELMYRERRIRVTTRPPAMIGRPAPDELVIVLGALRPGFESGRPQVFP